MNAPVWTPWTDTVAAAIRAVAGPVSVRRVAKAAGVSHAELSRIATGARSVTRNVAERVIRACEALEAEHRQGAAQCVRQAAAIRAALRKGGSR